MSSLINEKSSMADDLLSRGLSTMRVSDQPQSPGMSSAASTPQGSWSSRPSRPRPGLGLPGLGNGGFNGNAQRLPPKPMVLPFEIKTPSGPLDYTGGRSNELSGLEQDRKMKEIMSQTGQLQINGTRVHTAIDDMELLCDLGNGTCGHVVKMQHKPTGHVIAVKQMRRTGNSDENKRILMDLDIVLKSHDCKHIVLCLGCFITDSDVWICMELMATCFDKLLKQLKQAIPETICGKVAVSTVQALNYLKERHGIIHRDIKPSNILLDWNGCIKLCDFGISGRLVDSKAKTRSAGCAAYMAPERIDPPDPKKPDYDIRADVWSLGITLVELATGRFPYHDCKTDFEMLTKVLEDDPPLLPRNQGFSIEFCAFVRDCLMKDYKDRPKYKKLLVHRFIDRYEHEEVDVGAWYRSHMEKAEASNSNVSPNNNSTASSLSNAVLHPDATTPPSPVERSFKPQPSPRVPRAWKPTPLHQSPSPSHSPHIAYPSASSPIVDPQRAYSRTTSREHRRPSAELQSRLPSGHFSTSSRHGTYYPEQPYYHIPPGSGYYGTPLSDRSHPAYASSTTSSPLSRPTHVTTGMYGPRSLQDDPLHQPTSRYNYASPQSAAASASSAQRDSPQAQKKFDFTFPTSLQQLSQPSAASHLYHRFRTGQQQQPVHSLDQTPPQQIHGGAMAPMSSSAMASDAASTSAGGSWSPRMAMSEYVPLSSRVTSEHLQQSSSTSPTSGPERSGRSYLPTWSSLSSSWSNWQSPMVSLRRLRTASSDRSAAFSTTRRFQPNYRSWNDKDNYYSSLNKR